MTKIPALAPLVFVLVLLATPHARVKASSDPPFLPVEIYVAWYNADCSGATTPGSSFQVSSKNGAAVAGSSIGPNGAAAAAGADALSVGPQFDPNTGYVPVKLGEIVGPDSVVSLTGLGTQASAAGGWAGVLLTDLFSASGHVGLCKASVRLSFSNPNAYAVLLNMDIRLHAFSAAGNEAATNPFGYPGKADIGGGDLDRSADGVATNTLYDRLKYVPGGNTLEVAKSMTCFEEAQDICDAHPPTDQVIHLGGSGSLLPNSGGLLIPAGATPDGPTISISAFDLQAEGSSKLARNPATDEVFLIRSGYGAISDAVSVTITRADVSLAQAEASVPATLQVTGHSPIALTVIDALGRRAGFNAAPNRPAPADPQPSVLTEIFGASYGGLGVHPQVVTIPEPRMDGYHVTVLGTDSAPYTLTFETRNPDGVVLDTKDRLGVAGPGSVDGFDVMVHADGQVEVTGGPPPSDVTPPTTSVVSSPPANAAGWNATNVLVTLSSADDDGGSGVASLTFSADGAQSIPATTVSGANASITFTSEGESTLTYFATDNAGNTESPHTLVVKLDKTAPVLACTASPTQLWPPNHLMIPVVADVRVSDSVSGPGGFLLISAGSSEPADPDAIQGFATGQASVNGLLRAERSGAGSGRLYRLRYRGFDLAGNATTCDVVVTVPHDQRSPAVK